MNLEQDHTRILEVDGRQIACIFIGEDEDPEGDCTHSLEYVFWLGDIRASIKMRYTNEEKLLRHWNRPDFNDVVSESIRPVIETLQ